MPLNIALIFPGQGAQKVGMGLEFFQNSPQAKAVFEEADRICANNLTKVVFEGPEDKLTSTAYSQPAIFTVSVAALEAFKAHPKFKNYDVKFTAGHSLGEYAALYAAGVMPFDEALRLVQKRASCMEEAARENQGAMTAVIGFESSKLVEICRRTGAEIANFNSNEQIVITGHKAKVEAAMEEIKAAGGQKIIPLTVSGAFHSSLMASAASKFAEALKEISFSPSQVPVLSNVTGLPHSSNPVNLVSSVVIPAQAGIQDNLARQITSSVQWVKCVEYMASQGIKNFIEIGPGKVLKGLIRRIDPALTVSNIEKPQDIEALAL
ncbi:MAG: ACP S-malonyltransferase [Candidatus Omnitrophica bacterium]|nr:ACP S-malonyltransferase [Candidatus Omnitrophota bacterium]